MSIMPEINLINVVEWKKCNIIVHYCVDSRKESVFQAISCSKCRDAQTGGNW